MRNDSGAPQGLETRGGVQAEIRSGPDLVNVAGYAAVFNEWTDIGGWWLERVAPGAFAESIRADDVVFLINHEGLPLARSRGGRGTLGLAEDSRGLAVSASLDPDDPDVKLIVPKMKRGDLDKMSFAFRVLKQEWDETGETPKRTITKVELVDVAIVTQPAYAGTEIGLRSLEAQRAAGGAGTSIIAPGRLIRRRLHMRHELALRGVN